MRAFYRLLNYELGELLRGMLLLCAALIAASWLLVRNELKHYNSQAVHERFEDVYRASGMPIVFLLCMLVLLVLWAKSIYSAYWGSKSIYTLLTLPVKRAALYWSKLCAFGISLMLLLSSQLAGFVLAYRVMDNKIAGYSEGQFEMSNGLFLAFIRSDFMRLLWSYDPVNLLSTASIVIVITTGLYYGVICERSKRKWGWVLFPIAIWLMIVVISARLNPVYDYHTLQIVSYSAVLLAISAIFIWHSIHVLKKGAIA